MASLCKIAHICFNFPQDGVTPLYVAAQNNYTKVAELLLAAGANVDQAMNVRRKSLCLCEWLQQALQLTN